MRALPIDPTPTSPTSTSWTAVCGLLLGFLAGTASLRAAAFVVGPPRTRRTVFKPEK